MSGIEGAEPLAPTTDAMRRDMLAADNATLRQTCEEFRLMLINTATQLQFASAGLPPGSNARTNADYCVERARALLTKSAPSGPSTKDLVDMLKLAEMRLATTGNEIDGRIAIRISDLLKAHR